MPACVVCEAHAARLYKCANCRAPFCSSSCYRVHRGSSTCEAATETPTDVDFKRPASSHEPCVDDESYAMLKEKQCVALASDARLRDMLKSKELHKVLRIIDNS